MLRHMYNWLNRVQAVRDNLLPVGAVFRDARFAPAMLVVTPGSFTMGASDVEPGYSSYEGPQHTVTIAYRLAMGRYPVTFSEWGFAQADKDWQRLSGIEARIPDDLGWGRVDRPVIGVSWLDAQAYVKWLAGTTGKPYRLPSEAEWEYVARAGTRTQYSFGKDATMVGEHAWFLENSGGKTHPVRKKKSNPWGLYDMHGNVMEWCEDIWFGSYDDAPDDGSARTDVADTRSAPSNRVLRGGGWDSGPRGLRSGYRLPEKADFRLDSGFRVARTLFEKRCE